MFLFVGLGNPGLKYENTPHNAGFMWMDEFRDVLGHSRGYQVDDWATDKYVLSVCCTAKTDDTKFAVLLKPQTFMNLSGNAVKPAVKKWDIVISRDFVLIHDDLDIKLGEFKIQFAKKPKDHNGIESVESVLGRGDFWRVRLGVDNREGKSRIAGEDYVVRKYSEDELSILRETIHSSIKSLRNLLEV